jgi:hypothetical protein
VSDADTVAELFDDVAGRLAAGDPGLERGRILHADGLKAAGKFCAFVTGGALVVKLPAERVGELVAEGVGSPFDAGKGRPMREWVRLRPADEAACAAYVVEAQRFVAAQARLRKGKE